jgi:hypothetical protein
MEITLLNEKQTQNWNPHKKEKNTMFGMIIAKTTLTTHLSGSRRAGEGSLRRMPP